MNNSWTFGIITGGGEDERINRMIDSIELQNIPENLYEIIIVGGEPIKRKNTKCITFNESIKANWITKKKNIICQKAKFENIVLTHDYILFDKDWYSGWEKFNDFSWDVCMNRILNGDGSRFRDWCTQNPLFLVPYDMTAFARCMYVSGTYWCAKKTFMLSNPLNENHVWNQWEDVEWSFRVRDSWNYKCNPHSIVKSMKQKVSWINPDSTVGEAIHYALIEQLVNKECEQKYVHLDSRLAPACNTNLQSIHYVEFDMLRKFIRNSKPQNGLVVGGGDGLSALACAWAMSEYGGKLDVADSYMLQFCNNMDDIVQNYNNKKVYKDTYCEKILKFMLNKFGWSSMCKINTVCIPDELSDVFANRKFDFIYLDALAMDHYRLLDLDVLKYLLAANGTILMNYRGNNLSVSMSDWASKNMMRNWNYEFGSFYSLKND